MIIHIFLKEGAVLHNDNCIGKENDEKDVFSRTGFNFARITDGNK